MKRGIRQYTFGGVKSRCDEFLIGSFKNKFLNGQYIFDLRIEGFSVHFHGMS